MDWLPHSFAVMIVMNILWMKKVLNSINQFHSNIKINFTAELSKAIRYKFNMIFDYRFLNQSYIHSPLFFYLNSCHDIFSAKQQLA